MYLNDLSYKLHSSARRLVFSISLFAILSPAFHVCKIMVLRRNIPKMHLIYDKIPLTDLLLEVPSNVVNYHRPSSFRNKYFGLRHGESDANLEGIISSDPIIGSTIHGLTPKGQQQARQSATSLLDHVGRENLCNMIVISSNFTRAHQTAKECCDAIERILQFENAPLIHTKKSSGTLGPINIRSELRERYFGELNALPLIFYNWVWPVDSIDANNTRHGVESVNEVLERVSSLVSELEATYSGKSIVLVSHADTLQITQTYIAGGADPRLFAQYRFRNGEVRNMENLPPPMPLEYK